MTRISPWETDTDWDNLEPGTLIRVVSRQGFTLQTDRDMHLDPDLNPTYVNTYGISMKRGDVALVLGYDRKRNWPGEQGIRHIRLYAHGKIGWYDTRALDSMFRVLRSL